MKKKDPCYVKSMSTNFPVSSYTIGFVPFSCAMGNEWVNPCIYHIMKCTTEWELNGKKHSYHGKSMSSHFLCSPHTMCFVAFSHPMGRWWQNSYISHMMIVINFFQWKLKDHWPFPWQLRKMTLHLWLSPENTKSLE